MDVTTGSRTRARSVTPAQEAAYAAQFAAGLPVSTAARAVLVTRSGLIPYQRCAGYLHSVQRADWFLTAFPGHTEPVMVVGGRGVSSTDADEWLIKIGSYDRYEAGACEHACLHELAHLVTRDLDAGKLLREPVDGEASSRGHHHAWRANFVMIVRGTLGGPAASRLRREFGAWGLPTHP